MLKFLNTGAIFLSAFLLFLVQPMIAKMILPWFGGASTVWITCIVFFQTTLLAGYAYSHYLAGKLRSARQMQVHIILLVLSLFMLPVAVSPDWKPFGDSDPGLRILGLLTVTIGLPFFLLSSTSPLLQAWYARTYTKTLPYRLFALSNFASLLGLLAYPFLIEPHLTLGQQSIIWSICYGVFALLCCSVSYFSRKKEAGSFCEAPETDSFRPMEEQCSPPALKDKVLWLALAACSSLLLVATTDHLLQNIAAIPLFWILPLSIYLLSFTLCFDRNGWYNRKWYFWIVFIALTGMSYGLGKWGIVTDIRKVMTAYCIGLFVCCMFCHGELAFRKPAPLYLTSFYLHISLGGALGSMFAALAAPHLFSFYFELPIGLILCAVLLFAVNFRRWWVVDVACGALIIRLIVIAILYMQYFSTSDDIRIVMRNFYGHQRVVENDKGTKSEYRSLMHGSITHGIQFTAPEKKSIPTTYFGTETGVGLAIKALPESPRRIGIVGLGAGTLAAYARKGDVVRYYEINPQVEYLARREFTFLSDSRGNVDVQLGDGRLLLEQETRQHYDLLVIDVFSGDSVPLHFLTIEAMQLYFSHLKPGGIIAFNVSNLYLDLPPVIEKIARRLDKHAIAIVNQEDPESLVYQAEWVLVSSDQSVFNTPALQRLRTPITAKPEMKVWTDNYSNLLQAFN